jgi:hypothetical protein
MTFFLQVAMVLLSVQTADISFTIDPSAVDVIPFRGEEVVCIPGGASPFASGDPALPGISYSLVIPQGTLLEDVEIVVQSKIDLPGTYRIAPVLSIPLNEVIPVIIPHSENYSRGVFPAAAIHDIRTGNKTGFRIASFNYVPFTWDPYTGILSLVTSAQLTPVISPASDAPSLTLSDNQVRIAREALESIVRNPEMLAAFAPEVTGGVDGAAWVVIADESHQATLQPLVDLRASTHGSEFVSTQWISANYTGRDTQEQIRNYLKDAYENDGLVYALIVGDYGPTTRISGLTLGGTTMNSVADLYYSDLDGSWDEDGDNIFGELSDGVDYYSDIYTGRFSTDMPARLAKMVERTVAYETTAPEGAWRTTALLAGAGLWPDPAPGYWGSFICDSIDTRIPDSWTVHKLYETYESHPNDQISLYNQGVSYSSPTGHGFDGGVYWYYNPPTDIISAANYSDLTNDDMPIVFHSIACLAGNLQNVACIAERLMFAPSGGAIAVMFNSNNGYGSPPNMGASEWLELFFAEVLFVDQQNEIGVAHSISKDEFRANVSVSMQTWILQENNLLGDPALRFIAGQTGIEEEEGGASEAAPLISTPSPNPVNGTCAIGFSMPSAGTAEITVYDVSGRTAAVVYSGNLNAGLGSVSFNTSTLPVGCYSVVISSQTGSASTRMMVLH